MGALWFAIDYIFAYSLQLFFQSIKLLPANPTTSYFFNSSHVSIKTTALTLLTVSFLRFITQTYKIYNTQSIYEYMVANLRIKLLKTIETKEATLNSHEIISYFTDNIGGCATFFSLSANSILYIISSILLSLACFKISIMITLVAVSTVVLFFVPLKLTNKAIVNYGKKYQYHYDKIYRNIVINLKNLNYLEIYNKEESEFKNGLEHIHLYAKNASSYYFLYGLKTSFPFLVGIIAILIIAIFSTHFSLIPTSDLLSFSYLFMRICQNLGELNAAMADSNRLKLEVERSKNWLSKKSNIADSNLLYQQTLSDLNINEINCKNLSFKFPAASDYTLNEINFTCRKGEILLIKGKSGSGKSTLLKIILGILEPTRGELKINHYNASEIRKSLARKIGYVGPENYFTIGSLKENLLYLNENTNVSDDEMINVLNLLGLNFLTYNLNLQLNDDVQLSTGQKQRISIARALLRRPQLLVLDEATANLDSETENEIIKSLEGIKHEIIMVIISHKKSFDNIANNIIHFDRQ